MAVGRVVETDGNWEFEAPGEVVALLDVLFEGVREFGWPFLRIVIHRRSGKGDYYVLHSDPQYAAVIKFEYDANSLDRGYYEALKDALWKEYQAARTVGFDTSGGLWIPEVLDGAKYDDFQNDWSHVLRP